MPLFHTTITGIVQGVGFRPFVANLARAHHICGTVANKGPYVEIYAKGSRSACQTFFNAIKDNPPARAIILTMHTQELPASLRFDDFQIIKSAHEQGPIYVSPDIATCDDCARELYDPENPRYLHPFINCTNCGPRLTIQESAPYDRERTTMKDFPMCDRCASEYHDPKNRRYDAQPVCCPDCGPHVCLLQKNSSIPAITAARRALIEGQIIAIKGIGGFHLACDATNEQAVSLLRTRKHRPQKPFALMARNLAAIETVAIIETDAQRALLTGHQKPILLLKKNASPSRLAPSVAPHTTKLGLMLPYTPLHMLLFRYPDGLDDAMPRLLVMTSGNPSGAPICHTDEEALESLGTIADLILTHNRPIRLRADDTVLDWHENHPYPIRRSRGFSPLPIYFEGLDSSACHELQSLAIGAELKNTFTLARGPLLYASPYIGDTTDLRTVLALEDSTHLLSSLLAIHPQIIACDLHPRYNTTALARKLADKLHVPLFPVQHHYAHILSCLAENSETGPVLGLALDGTGYGPDGTIWGGELLRADLAGYTRLASIDPFDQAGGDKAPREPWRIAMSLLRQTMPDLKKEIVSLLHLCTEKEFSAQTFLLDHHLNCITSTSAGRLFDAVSALLGFCTHSTYEGEAPSRLQAAAEIWADIHPEKSSSLITSTPSQQPPPPSQHFFIATTNLFAELAKRRLASLSDASVTPAERKNLVGELAYTFHASLAKLLADACETAREKTGLATVVLSGGVFQNTLLLTLTESQLHARHFRTLIHREVPPNDGGLSLGQALAAQYHLTYQK